MADDRDDRAWRARVIDECSRDVEAGLDHSLSNAPGRVRLARAALERLCRAVTRCPDEAVEAARLDERARCAVRLSRILDRSRAEARVEGMEAAAAVVDEYEAQARRETGWAEDRVVHAAFADGAHDAAARIRGRIEAERRSRLEALDEAASAEERSFPVHSDLQRLWRRHPDAPRSVPWRLLAPHEARVLSNHQQSLERLAERGGLSPGEIRCAVEDSSLRDHRWDADAQREDVEWLIEWLARDDDGEVVQPAALASGRSRLEMMARGEAWPVDARDRAVVARSIRLVLDRLSEVEQCAAILDDHANPEARLR